jgi:mRNA interferase RelE/StbE
MYRVELNHSSQRFFEEADAPLQRRLDRCFQQLRAEPHRHPNIRRLRGPLGGLFRYRLGDVRVIYSINELSRTVNVVEIGNRRDVYE